MRSLKPSSRVSSSSHLRRRRPLLLQQLPPQVCCHQQRTYTAAKPKKSSPTTKGIGVQWAPKILLDPLFQNESERRRQRRLARSSLLAAQSPHNNKDRAYMQREVPLNDILEWIQETAPDLPDLQERRALTDHMGEMLRKSGWKIHSSPTGYNQLVRLFKFRGFQDSFLFLARLSQIVTLSDHFPEIEWDKHHIWVKLKTFGMNAKRQQTEDPSAVYFVSKSDVDMAKLINSLVDEMTANDQILPDILPTAAKRVGRNLQRDIEKIVQSKDDCKLEELVHQVLKLQVS
ncbi:hypothetical protein V1509DRAFT_621327 [Lipomyces kononenkoae]